MIVAEVIAKSFPVESSTRTGSGINWCIGVGGRVDGVGVTAVLPAHAETSSVTTRVVTVWRMARGYQGASAWRWRSGRGQAIIMT